MSKIWRKITVLPQLIPRFGHAVYNKDGKLVGYLFCSECGKPLPVGVEAWSHSKPRAKTPIREYYCVKCHNKIVRY